MLGLKVGRTGFGSILDIFTGLAVLRGVVAVEEIDLEKFSVAKRTSLREFLEQNPDV